MKQPFLRFYLDGRPNKNGERQIFLDISIGYAEIDVTKQVKNFKSDRKKYTPIKLSAFCRIKAENFGKQIKKGNRTVFVFDEKVFNKYSKTNRSIKTRLAKIENVVNEVTNQFYIQEVNPTPKEFKEVLETRLGRKQKEVIKEETVLAFLYAKIESDREAIKMKKKDALSENHIKTYVSLSRMFENYHIATSTEITFSDFNSKDFYWDFFKIVDAVYRGEIEVENPNQKKKQRKDPTGYGIKSINKYVKLLHRVLSLGKAKGYNLTLDLSDSSLSLENPSAEKEIYLNESEILKAINCSVDNEFLENARQYLIMASLMGLRVEDMESLSGLQPEIFKTRKREFLGVKVDIGKTKSQTIIPILKPVRDILSNNNTTFPVFKEHLVNVWLKKICKLLEINSFEQRTKISFNQGKIVTTDIPKYKLVSTHDCRRSFVTNLLSNNINGERVKYITHPKKEDSKDMMALYNKADLIDKAESFLDEIKNCNSLVYTY
jgi:hypothetical protein